MASTKLSVGIVGLPNVGKSTLFNALLKKQAAYAANFPFATIEPNVGIVPVPDERLARLAEVVKTSEKLDQLPPQVPATCEFVDIAGLIAGAHKGEGLGNKFLSHIRETDAICHVLRAFKDENIVKEGSVDPKSDLEVVETELKLADLQTLERIKNAQKKGASENLHHKVSALTKLMDGLSKGIPARDVKLSDEERKASYEFHLLTAKPVLIVLNVDENDLVNVEKIESDYALEFGIPAGCVIGICAKVESELAALAENDQKEYLASLGITESGLEKLIRKAFNTLGLITFLTAGVKEARAWTIRNGTLAPQAAAAIHSDFENKFIKADVCDFDDFVRCGGWKMAREKGMVKIEGKDYVVKDGDVIEFKIGT
ncbi:MAG: redox-regulated ATPase YchF [Patescibacteria group bacterium]|nr:redox-regulated ATPase YchF [Patescibacteria group bacterium]